MRHENVLFSGPTGVGKSHLANALGVETLKREMKVLSYPLRHLLKSLHASRANGGYSRMLARVLKVDLLIPDDFGLYPLTGQESQDLYEIISGRYEHGSVIVTSNRAFREWPEMFHDDLLDSATLDRLTHHAHTVTIRGKSYRQRSRGKEVVGEGPASPAESKKS